ncbi:MAG: substrate-binding domain-containing protein [Clostridia bacterium]|nr:substrate-binding domain-containing protein [Clostridia bacterium]
MRKFIGYIPAALFTGFYMCARWTGASLTISMILVWLACFWISAFFLHKGLFWGGIFGIFPGIHMIYMGTQYTGQVINIEIPLGIILILFYGIFGFYLWKKRNDIPKADNKEIIVMVVKIALTIATLMVTAYFGIVGAMILTSEGIHPVLTGISAFVILSLFLPLIWLKKRKKFFLIWLIPAAIYFIALGINYGMVQYDKSITINTSPNINVHEYLPFEEDSKIVKYDSKTLKLTDNLPKIDGAAALFPVYSAFVNAVYPDTTELHDGIFEYNNTPEGYQNLAEKKTDIFIGVYPSEDQIAYAGTNNTTYKYTPIGTEAFVFFVHKDNPIENLTTEQIQGIYSGEITNWKQVGGKNEEIAAFQRNEGSGSQSMLERFMGDKPIMEAPTELKNDLMSGIIERVSNYKNKTNSIGFSFRYYVEGIIKNPDIKMISIDGIAPTAENIKNGTYPVVTPIYAVTYEEQTNENVDKLLNWILSDEGQYIIDETGYVGIPGGIDYEE